MSENGQTAARARAMSGFVTRAMTQERKAAREASALDPHACYRALRARDRRFDGVFFVGVTTTGIYCRPICPAKTPAEARCRLFSHAAQAEAAGFRACLRCRPEVAPGLAPRALREQRVARAVAAIEAGALDEGSLDALADSLGVTARHLRRLMVDELGVSPVQLAQTTRVALAKQLLHDTRLPLAEIAFASGFGSVRRFNALMRARFASAPSLLRRAPASADAQNAPRVSDAHPPRPLTLRVDYRAPFDYAALLEFLGGRATAGVEDVRDGVYTRSLALGEHVGLVSVRCDAGQRALCASVSLSLAPRLLTVAARLREAFDVSARPDVIAADLGRDPALRPLVAACPGLRVPGSFDGFETAVRTVLGQQVSVRAATTICGRLVARFGTALPDALAAEAVAVGCDLTHVFPTPSALAAADVTSVQAVGLPRARAETLVALARAVQSGELLLNSAADPESTQAALRRIRGIGPWTASYLAMRVLRDPNAFPAGDLVLRKALGVESERAAIERARSLQPWRAYAVMHLWRGYAVRAGGAQGG